MKGTGMILNGNRVIVASALLLAVNLANAAAPSLVEFTAATSAKASEVNANFESLKTYAAGLEDVLNAQTALITALENKATAAETERTSIEGKVTLLETESENLQSQISALENGEKYTIAVYGDGGLEPIGFTNTPKTSNDKQYMVIKTAHGMATLKSKYDSTEYILQDYDPLSDDADSNSIHFSDSSCTNPITVLSQNEIGASLFFTKVKGVTDVAIIATSESSAYIAAAGSLFSDTIIDFYQPNNGACELSSSYVQGSVYIPVVEMSEQTHGLKSSYSTITLEGYFSN